MMKMLMEQEKTGTFVRLYKRGVALDVHIGMLGGLLGVDNDLGHTILIPNTGGRFIIT